MENAKKINEIMAQVTEIEQSIKKAKYISSGIYQDLEDTMQNEPTFDDLMLSQKDVSMNIDIVLDYISYTENKIKTIDDMLEKLYQETREN